MTITPDVADLCSVILNSSRRPEAKLDALTTLKSSAVDQAERDDVERAIEWLFRNSMDCQGTGA